MISKILDSIKKRIFPAVPVTMLKKLEPAFSAFETVFDVGAYHGKFADEVLQMQPKLKVHCFEPFLGSFNFLAAKYQQQKAVTINHCAVSNSSGTASLNVNSFQETNSLLESAPVDDSIDLLTSKQSIEEVRVITLDEYCFQNDIKHIDLLKIDTQGNSYNVLCGVERMLQEKKISFLYVEAEFIEIYKHEKLFSEIEILMRGFGYGIVDIYNMNYINNEKLAWCDALFTINKN